LFSDADSALAELHASQVRDLITAGKPGWETMVESGTASLIKSQGLYTARSEARNLLFNGTIQGPFTQQTPLQIIGQWLSRQQRSFGDFAWFNARVFRGY